MRRWPVRSQPQRSLRAATTVRPRPHSAVGVRLAGFQAEWAVIPYLDHEGLLAGPQAQADRRAFSAGAHASMDSAFWILSFDPPTDGEVVYFEHPTCSLYLEKPDEVARNLPGIVAVRDSKNPHGPVLIVNRDERASFITCLRVGQPARQK